MLPRFREEKRLIALTLWRTSRMTYFLQGRRPAANLESPRLFETGQKYHFKHFTSFVMAFNSSVETADIAGVLKQCRVSNGIPLFSIAWIKPLCLTALHSMAKSAPSRHQLMALPNRPSHRYQIPELPDSHQAHTKLAPSRSLTSQKGEVQIWLDNMRLSLFCPFHRLVHFRF